MKRFIPALMLMAVTLSSCKSSENYTFTVTEEISGYLDGWLGDNPYPEQCRPAGYYIERMELFAGDFIEGIALRLDEIASNEPSQVFFLGGCNNFVKGLTNTPEDVMASLDRFFRTFRKKMPETPLHVQSLMPMNPAAIDWNDHYNADVAAVNAFLIANADKYGYDYIDIASPLTDADGTLRSDLTEDGCHPNEAAYAIWAETIKNKIIK